MWRSGLGSAVLHSHSSLIIARPTIIATNIKVSQSSLAIEVIFEIIAAWFVSPSTPPVTGCTHLPRVTRLVCLVSLLVAGSYSIHRRGG